MSDRGERERGRGRERERERERIITMVMATATYEKHLFLLVVEAGFAAAWSSACADSPVSFARFLSLSGLSMEQ